MTEQFIIESREPPTIKNEDTLAGTLGFDSLDIVEITMGIEDDFGLDIDDGTMFAFSTVQSVIDYVTANAKA
jgi:acyl carrier protein